MDLQRSDEPFRASEGDYARYDRRDAFPDPVLGHFQQHDREVCGAHAEEQIIDRSVFKQITHEDNINNGDQLKYDILTGSADSPRL